MQILCPENDPDLTGERASGLTESGNRIPTGGTRGHRLETARGRGRAGPFRRIVLRETRSNRYSLNWLAAVAAASGVPWRAAATPKALIEAASGRGPVLVGYSFMTPDLEEVAREAAELKHRTPHALWVAGGAHPTADPEGTLALGFDRVFVGEADRTFPAFLAEGDGSRVIRDPEGGPPTLDPYPCFGPERPGPVEITRGCRARCGYCAVGRRRVRHRAPGTVERWTRLLVAEGRRLIRFITPDALGYGWGLEVLEELLARVRAAGGEPVLGAFPSEVRPERVTPEAVHLLGRYCHNRVLVIGAQSGSPRILQRIRRGHTVEHVLEAARIARWGGFLPHVDLIFGLPGETPDDQAATVELARRLIRECGARIHAHYFLPLPGTPLWGHAPAPLYPKTRNFLEQASAGGALDGRWREQQVLAARIRGWAESGRIRVAWSECSMGCDDGPIE